MPNPELFFSILKLLGPAFVGGLVTHIFERRPRLITYYSHIAEFNAGNPPGRLHTHSVVIKNRGRAPAHNVRVPHVVPMDNIHVRPVVPYQLVPIPGGGEELVFPVIVATQEVTISYLYFPPLTFNQVNQAIRSDEGMAKFVPMNLTPVLKPWQRHGVLALLFLGIVTAVYFLAEGALWAFRVWRI